MLGILDCLVPSYYIFYLFQVVLTRQTKLLVFEYGGLLIVFHRVRVLYVYMSLLFSRFLHTILICVSHFGGENNTLTRIFMWQVDKRVSGNLMTSILITRNDEICMYCESMKTRNDTIKIILCVFLIFLIGILTGHTGDAISRIHKQWSMLLTRVTQIESGWRKRSFMQFWR